jgi:plastocyanin
MPRTRSALAAALLATACALAGCAGGAPAATQPAVGVSAPAGSGDAGGQVAGTTLLAVIGTADDPEAYAIGILDESGAVVTSVPAGDYSLTFVDESQMHNFHLTGEGVDVKTEVQGTDSSTVQITLVPGTYTFFCDPHPGTMLGELEVTG